MKDGNAPSTHGLTKFEVDTALSALSPDEIPLLQSSGAWVTRFLIRSFEISVALIVLILTSPIMLVIAMIIRWDSPGPALFFQKRLGLGAKTFRFVKFRTLYVDARQRFPELYAYRYTPEQLQDLRFKVDEDPRVTRCGAWLRRTSLDELPNFWNVLTGQMALVGPRPEIPEMLPYYRGNMLLKFSVRPGVTGPAQISGRGRLGFFETVNFDLEYIRKRSFCYDVKVMLTTVRKVFLQDGAF
jgi:lipopolysaccharide/colanic/teichoic acid biosynthesis glycosyltransferase